MRLWMNLTDTRVIVAGHSLPHYGHADILRELIGAGSSALGRVRAGFDLARSFNGASNMIVMHARLASQLADQLGLPDDVGHALAASYGQWDGTGRDGTGRDCLESSEAVRYLTMD